MYAACRIVALASARNVASVRNTTHFLSRIHTSALALELQKFTMPAMSPTMSDGGIASWHKKEGESFHSGDVLLEVVRGSC